MWRVQTSQDSYTRKTTSKYQKYYIVLIFNRSQEYTSTHQTVCSRWCFIFFNIMFYVPILIVKYDKCDCNIYIDNWSINVNYNCTSESCHLSHIAHTSDWSLGWLLWSVNFIGYRRFPSPQHRDAVQIKSGFTFAITSSIVLCALYYRL